MRVEMLSAFLDNQASPAERVRVESHLRTCAACRGELESLRRTAALLHALPRVAVPHAFTLSEAKAGIRRPEPRLAWFGGLARGLGAVTAVALVAVVAVTMLRPPAATPSESVARVAPTAAPAAAKMAEQPAPAADQPAMPAAVAPAPAPMEAQPQIMAAAETDAGEQPAAATAADAATDTAALAAAPAPEMAQAQATPDQAFQSQPAARGMAVEATPEPAMLAMAPSEPEATEAPSAKAFGMGGGAGEGPVLPAELLTPEPLPAIAAAADVLPLSTHLVYADLKALWAIGETSGVRQLAAAEVLHTPSISPDGTYVVYRTQQQGYEELWGVGWKGGAAKLLLSERDLPRENLDALHTERRLQDVRWAPGRLALALNIVQVASPTAPGAVAVVELWELDIKTGALEYLAPLGRAYRPFYAPNGRQFALLEYGTETDPRGSLVLYNAEGGNRKLAVSFPASSAKQSYDSQVAWLPDSSALWLAVPMADPPAAGQLNGTTLYRVTAAGQAQVAGLVDAYQVVWSPDGTRLAFLRITSSNMEDGELYLANADGSEAQRYAVVRNAAFLAWAPDGEHFLYQDDYRTYLGAEGQAPQHLGTSVSFVDPHWVSDTQFVSRHDTGTGWLLTVRGIDSATQGLISLPREAMVDIARP